MKYTNSTISDRRNVTGLKYRGRTSNMPTRRHFLETTAAGLAASALAAQDKTSANDRVQVATIGLGGMGTGDTHSSTAVPGVELVAVADIYQGRLDHAREVFGKDVFTTRDYREVLA